MSRLRGWWLVLLALSACDSRDKATSEARRFAEDMGYQVAGVTCMSYDTDGDNYVTCTVRIKDAEPGKDLLSLQCAITLSLNDGCKQTELKGNARTTIHTH